MTEHAGWPMEITEYMVENKNDGIIYAFQIHCDIVAYSNMSENQIKM